MDEENGFFKDTSIEMTKPVIIDMGNACTYCDSPFISKEMERAFNIYICNECKFSKIKLITKTTVYKEYLLINEDIDKCKYITRPNPHKGNWHDMCLYLEDDIVNISISKYGSMENVERIREERLEKIKNRKIKKLKHKIRDLKRKTFVRKEEKVGHTHKYIDNGKRKACEVCGMEVEQEII